MLSSKRLDPVTPGVAWRQPRILQAKLANKAPNHLGPIATALAELVWRKVGEERTGSDPNNELEKTTLNQRRVNRDYSLRSRSLERACFWYELHAPDVLNL